MSTANATLRNVEKSKPISLPKSEREKLVKEMIPHVKFIAQRMASHLPSIVEMGDLVHFGILGLLDASKKFDPRRGVKFKTYAETRIRGSILDGMRAADWAPRSVRKKKRELESCLLFLEHKLCRTAEEEEIAAQMGIRLNDYHQMLTDIKSATLGRFEEKVEFQDKEEGKNIYIQYVPHDLASNPLYVLEKKEMKKILAGIITELPEREKTVVTLYYYEELSMKEIGDVLGISESRISQIHTKAVTRIRSILKDVLENRRPIPAAGVM
jgi:RNA polymerase sigma factor for flagellar operon FliA